MIREAFLNQAKDLGLLPSLCQSEALGCYTEIRVLERAQQWLYTGTRGMV